MDVGKNDICELFSFIVRMFWIYSTLIVSSIWFYTPTTRVISFYKLFSAVWAQSGITEKLIQGLYFPQHFFFCRIDFLLNVDFDAIFKSESSIVDST